ncbi:MAG: hypothetical protein L3J84_09835 [Gammaproteobacteria bacterium]|nr:hypothetical protein [Gammaproteobacteria bacterium]
MTDCLLLTLDHFTDVRQGLFGDFQPAGRGHLETEALQETGEAGGRLSSQNACVTLVADPFGFPGDNQASGHCSSLIVFMSVKEQKHGRAE